MTQHSGTALIRFGREDHHRGNVITKYKRRTSIQRGDDQGKPSQKGILLEAGLEGAESSKKKRQKLGRSPRGGLQ